jgi:hypothetical protein
MDELKLMPAADLIAGEDVRRQRVFTDGWFTKDRQARWRYEDDNSNGLLVFEERDGEGWRWVYELDGNKLLTADECVDWIFQVHGKGWATAEVLKAMLDAIEDWRHPQGRLVFGRGPPVVTPRIEGTRAIVKCPYCKATHVHGIGGGHRVNDCIASTKGYYLRMP